MVNPGSAWFDPQGGLVRPDREKRRAMRFTNTRSSPGARLGVWRPQRGAAPRGRWDIITAMAKPPSEARAVLERFFHRLYVERDVRVIAEMRDDGAASVGLGPGILSNADFERFVVAQQVPHLVNKQRRVLFDRVPRDPRVVVVQAPVRVDGHAVDQISGDRNQAEERRREIAALIGRPHAGRLQRTGVPVGLTIRVANQIAECELHVSRAA